MLRAWLSNRAKRQLARSENPACFGGTGAGDGTFAKRRGRPTSPRRVEGSRFRQGGALALGLGASVETSPRRPLRGRNRGGLSEGLALFSSCWSVLRHVAKNCSLSRPARLLPWRHHQIVALARQCFARSDSPVHGARAFAGQIRHGYCCSTGHRYAHAQSI